MRRPLRLAYDGTQMEAPPRYTAGAQPNVRDCLMPQTMNTNPSTAARLLSLCLGTATVLLAGCAPAGGGTPTVGPEAIFTSAFETFSAQMATDQAASTPTNTQAPPPTPLPLPTFVLPTQPGFTFATPVPAGGTGGTAGCENDATWIADVTAPDGTIFTPGEDFKKTWLVQNIGTCTWNNKYTLEYKDGSKMAGGVAYVTISVPPGQQVEVSMDLEAPDGQGDFYGRWEIHDPDGRSFGSILTVVIKVQGTAQ